MSLGPISQAAIFHAQLNSIHYSLYIDEMQSEDHASIGVFPGHLGADWHQQSGRPQEIKSTTC